MPKAIQGAREALALSRKYGLKGKLPLMVDEVVAPVVIIGTLDDERDLSRQVLGTNFAIPGAAEVGILGVRNPDGSGVLGRLSEVIPSNIDGFDVFYDIGNLVVPDALLRSPFADLRLGGQESAMQLVEKAAVPLVFDQVYAYPQTGAGASPPLTPGQPFVIPPGSTVWLQSRELATTAQCNWTWTEELLEPSEVG